MFRVFINSMCVFIVIFFLAIVLLSLNSVKNEKPIFVPYAGNTSNESESVKRPADIIGVDLEVLIAKKGEPTIQKLIRSDQIIMMKFESPY